MSIHKAHTIEIQQEVLFLSPYKAVFWAGAEMLILADLHLGKTGFFRKNGIQIPSDLLHADLNRLDALIDCYHPKQIMVVGDLFHHEMNQDILVFKTWRQKYAAIDIFLVPGNHDRIAKWNFDDLGLALLPPTHVQTPFVFVHEMKERPTEDFMISGHLHPGYLMRGRARQTLRLPCFIYGRHHLVLPAFSDFTGLYTGYDLHANDNFLVISNDQLFAI